MTKQTMNRLFIIRGVPGSGVSTALNTLGQGFAKEHGGDVRSVDATEYLSDANGYYLPYSKLTWRRANRTAEVRVNSFMELSYPIILLGGNFIRKDDIEPYIELAKTHEYSVLILETHGRFKSKQPIDETIIDRMREKFYPTELLCF